MGNAIVTGHHIVPRTLRRPALAIAALAALAVVALGARNAGRGRSSYTDRLLQAAVESWIPDEQRGLGLIQRFGDPRAAAVLVVLLAVLALFANRRRLALLALLGPGLTGVATTLLKPLFDRTIQGSLAYPSGHTGAITAMAIVTSLLLVSVLRAGLLAGALVIAVSTASAGAVMAVTLTSLEVHYPTDTIGGFCTAVAVVLGCAVLIDTLAERRQRARTAV